MLVGMDIGVVTAIVIHGWLNSKGMRLEMSDVENVNTEQNEWIAGTHTQSLWGMLSEHTLERCRNCGAWKHEPMPCVTCQKLAA